MICKRELKEKEENLLLFIYFAKYIFLLNIIDLSIRQK